MLKPHDLKRRFRTLERILHEKGIRGVVSAIRDRVRFELRLFLFRRKKSITMNECTFDLSQLPNLSIKFALCDNTYENFERRAVLQYVHPEIPVIELGGCIGVVACITNKLLNDGVEHVVVEANPNVLAHLNRNRSTNHCDFEVLNAAISYDRSSVTFVPSEDFWGSSLNQTNAGDPVTVETIRLQDIIAQRNLKSFTLICDIEGYEYDLVKQETEVLRNADTIILETHARFIGDQKTAELLSTLQGLGFRTIQQDTFVYVLRHCV